ncbi:MAG: aldo/keto reductase [Flavobacteriia bacterium]|jgi:predicted oxidoreductase
MKKVLLSDSGPETSAAIYSFWRWNEVENLNVEKVSEIISYAISLGINSFDISPLYGNGKIEKLVGEAIQKLGLKRENLVLFSKIGNKIINEEGFFQYRELNDKSIQKQVDNSLSNLQTNYLDVLLVDGFDPLMNVEQVASSLTALQIRDKIKHIGVSEFNVQQHKLLASRLSSEVVTNHFELNLLETEALKDGRIDFIKENYSKPMAFGPLADGRILTGQDEKAVRVRNVLEILSKKYDSNIEQLAVAWIYKLGALPIIGSLSRNRILNAATAGNTELSYEDWHLIYTAIK